MKFKLRPFVIISISVVIGIIMIVSSYIELEQSKQEIFLLLNEESKSLTETISLSSINALNSSIQLESLITGRLLNNAYLIKKLDSLHLLTQNKLIEIARENDLFRINIFDKNGDRILSNRIPEPDHIHGPDAINRYDELSPILNGETDELIIGLKGAEFSNEQRFAVAVARVKNIGGAIVINLDAKDFVEFRKKIGIGKIIRDISDNEGLIYIILQDSVGILAASQNINAIESVESDKFLINAFNSDSIFSRINNFNNAEIFEVVKRLKFNDEIIGLFRIGLSLDEIRLVEERMLRRMIIISIILAAISIIVLSIIFTTQNLKTVSDEYSKYKILTDSVLQNMDEAVIVINKNKDIILFNISAEKLFQKKSSKIVGKNLDDISSANLSFINELVTNQSSSSGSLFLEKVLEISKKTYFVLISITTNFDESGNTENYTIVMKDITEVKRLEEQSKRNEKLTAMGELASGVAHEIRNPINAIGMIAQRLSKEFIPPENKEEYSSITNLLKNEVTRINKIITQFLNYAKPLEVNKTTIDSNIFFKDIHNLFITQADVKKINFNLESSENFYFHTDPDLLKQALMNIIQNGFDALGNNGSLSLSYLKENEYVIIEVKDNGIGIPDEYHSKVFDLYFSGKKEGNGLGLSISQKIISQLEGEISFKTKLNVGTTFKIILQL
jgi:two-component system sensor histidine kinase HydH